MNESIYRHPSPTDSPSPQPQESPNTIRRPKVRSYMSPTTSSRAKIMSLKEGLHLNLSSGQTSPCPVYSPTTPSRASTFHLPSLSAPLSGPCSSAESKFNHGRCPPISTVKITKARVSARVSYPPSEHPSRSTPTPSTDIAAFSNTMAKCAVQHGDKCYTMRKVEPAKSVSPISISQCVYVKDSLGPKTSSRTPQHPLVDVQAYSGTCSSKSYQGLSCLFVILVSVSIYLSLLNAVYLLLLIIGRICYSVIILPVIIITVK